MITRYFMVAKSQIENRTVSPYKKFTLIFRYFDNASNFLKSIYIYLFDLCINHKIWSF